jgi:hypothetical protein
MTPHSSGMRLRFLLLTALLVTALTAGPATAATSASKEKHRSDTWAGQVLRHGRHFDYQGSYCPTSAEACIKILAKFRIVPLTPQARIGLRQVAGGSAKLVGYQTPASDGEHNGILYVRRVKKA